MNTLAKIDPIPVTEINVFSMPAQLSVNFDEVKAALDRELEPFRRLVVTPDTLKGAKQLAADLNKRAAAIDDRRKTEVADVSAPIKQFDGQMKELVKLCKDGRQLIVDQVKRYEDETKAQILLKVVELRDQEWDAFGVEPEFRQAVVDDLAKLTAANDKGYLTKATRTEITNRVAADKTIQDKANTRLMQLELYSYRAGLTIPLTREHVQDFLMVPSDTAYVDGLNRVLAAEKDREARALAVQKAKWEREQAQTAKAVAAAQPAPAAPVAPAAPAEPSPYAFGLLSDDGAFELDATTFADAAQQMLDNSAGHDEPFGLWTNGELVAIAYGGELFRK